MDNAKTKLSRHGFAAFSLIRNKKRPTQGVRAFLKEALSGFEPQLDFLKRVGYQILINSLCRVDIPILRISRHTFTACLLLIITSCEEDDHFIYVDQRLQPYYDDFIENAARKGIEFSFNYNVTVVIRNDCFGRPCGGYGKYNRDERLVIVSSQVYENGPQHTEAVLWHEMGHSFLFRDHLQEQNEIGVPKSFMYQRYSWDLIEPAIYDSMVLIWKEEMFTSDAL